MTLKTIELIINYIVLLWLLMISYLTHPYSIHMEGLPLDINDQYGVAYMVRITLTIISSILIIIRLIKPLIIFRIISIVTILITITLTLVYWTEYPGFDEFIRNLIYGAISAD